MSQFYTEKLTVADKITKAKIHLMSKSPFYSYLVMHMKIERNDKVGTVAIDPDGNMFWNDEFLKGKDNEELMAILCHEVKHCVLRHPQRLKGRDMNMANIAMDAVVNDMLKENGFKLPKECIIPRNHSIVFMGKRITDIDKKIWEEIYDEIAKIRQDGKGNGKKKADEDDGEGSGGNNSADGDYEFDKHMPESQKKNDDSNQIKKDSGTDGMGGTNEENPTGNSQENENKPEEISKNKEDLDEKWGRILSEATTRAKMHGEQFGGMDRYIEKLLNPKQSWEQILSREIVHECVVDYDWSTPSRRSHEYGIYLPAQKKENIELALAIDSSGSIDNKLLKTFLSQTRDIIGSFRNISITAIVCDHKIQSVHEFTNANIADISKIKPKGGGGTSFQEPIDFVAKNKPNVKLLIYLTDGEASRPNTAKFNGRILWVLPKDGTMDNIKGTGNIMKMEE
jgi:predicted metal-dependent peptidase